MITRSELMTPAQHGKICHALGLRKKNGGGFRCRWAYRNYFDAGENDRPVWHEMERQGWAVRVHVPAWDRQVFAVTRRGMAAAGLLAYIPKKLRLCAPE